MESWICGPHRLEFEPPDVFHCYSRGITEEQHLRELVRIVEEFCAQRGIRAFFVIHLSKEAHTITQGARQYLVATPMPNWKGVLMVGGNPIMRMTATVLWRAHQLLKPHTVPTVLVASMDEARRCMDGIRAKEAAGAEPPVAKTA